LKLLVSPEINSVKSINITHNWQHRFWAGVCHLTFCGTSSRDIFAEWN
jgi:hypothetical protein